MVPRHSYRTTSYPSPSSTIFRAQVIHYTIVATNDGNTTLAAVTVTDPKVSGLSCTPANGSSLAPGASLNCTATHTVTQADIDAGHYANQACADDGAGGAAQACANADVPGSRLSLTKVASPQTYSAVGQSISYFYIVTNTGQASLAGPVTITDDKTTATCPDLTGIGNHDSRLDPGESV